MTVTPFTIKVPTKRKTLVAHYWPDTTKVIVEDPKPEWTRRDCDLIREAIQHLHPNLPVIFGKQLGSK